jgi:hypothetical protein
MSNKFKRIFFYCLVLALLSGTGYCQKFKMGLQAGINGSQIWGDHMAGFNKGGLLAGVVVDFKYTEKVNFSFELNYTEKGSRRIINESNTNPGDWNLYKASYLEVPVIFTYKFPKNFDLNLALACGFLVHEKYIDSLGVEMPDIHMTRNYDANAFLGINYHFGKNFLFGVRIQSSFITIGKGKSHPVWAKTNTGWINIVTSALLRYYLPF